MAWTKNTVTRACALFFHPYTKTMHHWKLIPPLFVFEESYSKKMWLHLSYSMKKIISSNICWTFYILRLVVFSISSIYESIVSVITILTMPMKYIKLCIWDVRFFVIVVHCFKALLIFPSVKNSLALSLSLSLSLLLIQF